MSYRGRDMFRNQVRYSSAARAVSRYLQDPVKSSPMVLELKVVVVVVFSPTSSGRARTSLIRPSVCPSVCPSVTMFDQIFLYQLLRLFCFVVSFQTPILENGMVRMGIFVANGTSRFCTKGRRPLVFRMPIRNVPFVFSKSDTWFRRNYA